MSKARQLADLGNVYDDGALSNRNLIINGAMQVAQRGTSFSSLTASQYCLDRFSVDIGGGGAITVAQSTTTPEDFKNSTSLTVATADSSIAAGDAYRITHAIEGQNVSQLNWGTSDAKSVTLSFWVRSSVTGTYGLGFANSAETENYIAEYNISSANTWEYKTITIEGRTSGTWLDTNGIGLGIRWDLGSGTNYNGTAGSWQTTGSKVYRTSSCVNWIANVGATFYLTGVQLEVGDLSTATPFEHRSYGDELARCQRYYFILTNDGDTTNYMTGVVETSNQAALTGVIFPTTMRAVPTASLLGTSVTKFYTPSIGTDDSVTIGTNRSSKTQGSLLITGFSGATIGQGGALYDGGSGSGVSFDAEL